MDEYFVKYLVHGGHCKLTTKLRCFSSCDDNETASSEYECDGDDFKKYFDAKFYCNGNCAINEGYVTIIFHSNCLKSGYYPLKFSCVASVIDSSGSKRFPQTAQVDSEYDEEDKARLIADWIGFGFEKYIKRSTLLSDPSELLPNGSLSLCLEIDYEVQTTEKKFHKYGTFESCIEQDDKNWYLRMYSDFGRELCKMSSVLRRMVCSPIKESKTGLVKVPPEEIDSFRIIFCILGEISVRINTMKDICDLYILADMYDMQQIIEVCRQLFVSTMHTMKRPAILKHVNKNIQDIIELARTFSKDEILADILRIHSDYSDKLKDAGFCGTLSEFLDSFSVIKWKTDWAAAHCMESWKEPYFVFSKSKSEDLPKDIYK